jgi:aryl-alcohol dehydrogenase-like predicted oxidoreductase
MTGTTITAAAAGTWRLGDRQVNRLGFGTLRLTGNGMLGNSDGVPIDRDRAIRVLRRAVDLGVNHIDTAAFYFSALRCANELINSALAPYPDDLVIVSKVGPTRDPSGAWLPPAPPEALRGQVEENLRQLGRDHLDVVNLRVVRQDSIAEHVGALADLRAAGLVAHIGVSNIEPRHLTEALAVTPLVCVQNRYGLDHRDAEDNGLLARCAELGIGFVPFFAISGDRLEATADGVDTPDDHVLAVARAHDATPAQVRLAWTLHQGRHVLAIPGTGDPTHLAENVAAAGLRLSQDELDLLGARPA